MEVTNTSLCGFKLDHSSSSLGHVHPMVLMFGPLIVSSGLWFLMAIGVVWAPIAAYLMYSTARRQGLHSFRYALAGVVYSLLLVFPWFFAMARLRSRQFPIGATLFALFVVWLLGPIGTVFVNYLVTFDMSQVPSEPSSTSRIAWVSAVVLIAMVFSWVASLMHVMRLDTTDTRTDRLPEHRYVIPFALASASALGLFVIVRL